MKKTTEIRRRSAGTEERRSRPEDGFTLMEVLVALVVLLIGISGLLSMQMTSLRATSFSRHATEASILAEDKMEELRTMAGSAVTDGSDTVDGHGNAASGPYTRSWTIAWDGLVGTLSVTVAWNERGNEPHSVVVATQRTP